jgi:hypothetical protein
MRTLTLLPSVLVLGTALWCQQPPSETATKPKEWLSSYAKFAQEMFLWGGEKPAQTIFGINEGQVVPETWAVMKAYGNQVVSWEAVFQGVGKPAEQFEENRTQGPRRNLKFDNVPLTSPSAPYAVDQQVVYAKPSSLENWKRIAAGTRIAFSAKIVGIQFNHMPIRGGVDFVQVTLHDAEPIKELGSSPQK